MEYPLMDPPSDVFPRPWALMTKREAKRYFEWFMGQIPNRLSLLAEAFSIRGGGSPKVLDFTPESLIDLWRWFIPLVSTEPKTPVEIEEELRQTPEWLAFMKQDWKLTKETLALAVDIAIYFAEVLIRQHERLHWGIHKTRSKRYAHLNRPEVLGFGRSRKLPLNPIGVVHGLTLKVAEGARDPLMLHEKYTVWDEYANMAKGGVESPPNDSIGKRVRGETLHLTGIEVAKMHGLSLPSYSAPSEAEERLYEERDRLIEELVAKSRESGITELDFSPESLKTLEGWYFTLWEDDCFEDLGVSRDRFERAMGVYFGEVLVRNAGFAWVVEAFPFTPGKYEMGVKRDLLTITLSQQRDLYARPGNTRRQALWRDYKRFAE